MQNIFIGFILGIVGSSIGAFIAHRFTICRDRKNTFNNAAIEFTESFLEELSMLKRFPMANGDNRACHILSIETLNRHEIAMMKFVTHLHGEKRERFRKEWCQYAYGDNDTQEPQPGEYFLTEKTLDEEQMRKKAIHRINMLLSFAKIK